MRPMKAQSLRAATRCETAKGKVCHCRCGGKLHGAARMKPEKAGVREFFEALPESDPHHVPSAEEKKRRARERRAAEKARDQGKLWAIFEPEEEKEKNDGSFPPDAA